MTVTTIPSELNRMLSKRILFETAVISIITLMGMWFFPPEKIIFALLPVAYLLIERRMRQRSWGNLGFSVRTFWADLRANWVLFIVLGFVMQPVIALWAKANFPEFLAHVQARLPFESGIGWLTLLPLLAISLVGEEMTYRTLIQGRLAPFIGIPAAVATASVLFGLAHIAPGAGLVVLMDHFTTPWMLVLRFLITPPLAYTASRKQNIVPGIIVHAIANGVDVIMGFLYIMNM